MIDNYLTIKETREFLAMNGIDWSLSWIRMQVYLGKIPSEKMFSSRVISRDALQKIIVGRRCA